MLLLLTTLLPSFRGYFAVVARVVLDEPAALVIRRVHEIRGREHAEDGVDSACPFDVVADGVRDAGAMCDAAGLLFEADGVIFILLFVADGVIFILMIVVFKSAILIGW